MAKSSSNQPSSDLLADVAVKLMMAGGIAGGGTGALWSILKNSDFPRAIASAVIGLGIAYAARMLMPIHEGNQRRLERAGKAIDAGIDWVSEQAIATATRFEDKYLLCQASECQAFRSEGVPQKEGIFVPLLKEVFIPVGLDFSATKAGFKAIGKKSDMNTDRTIWDFLIEARRQPKFRQLAILAWGGYGKTTLLRHIAFRYGTKQPVDQAPKLIPFLLILREYREILSGINPPNLPELIMHHHLPKLSGGEMLKPPKNWARFVLRRGDALVMLDGFDEIPIDERPAIARWINYQIRQYGKSVFILTSRPKAYKEQDPASRLNLETPIWVKDFNAEQRKSFISRWYFCQEKYTNMGRDTPDVRKIASRLAQDLIHQVETRKELKALAKNPLLLNMIASFHRRFPGAELPKRQVELYKEICALQLHERPRSRRLETVLSQYDPLPILQKVALFMLQKRLERIDHHSLSRGVTKLLEASDAPIDAATFIQDVVDVGELLIKQEDEYEFSHLSFQEYLAATCIAQEKRESAIYPYLKDDWWRPTILLYAAQVNPTQLIRKAMTAGANDLAYACLQETTKRVDEKVVTDLKTLAKQVQDARYRDLKSSLRKGDWHAADRETSRLIFVALGKEFGQSFRFEEFEHIPREELKAIDWLWVSFSQNKFGFSVQKQVYLSTDPAHREDSHIRLFNALQWSDINYSQRQAPMGHLPSFFRYMYGQEALKTLVRLF